MGYTQGTSNIKMTPNEIEMAAINNGYDEILENCNLADENIDDICGNLHENIDKFKETLKFEISRVRRLAAQVKDEFLTELNANKDLISKMESLKALSLDSQTFSSVVCTDLLEKLNDCVFDRIKCIPAEFEGVLMRSLSDSTASDLHRIGADTDDDDVFSHDDQTANEPPGYLNGIHMFKPNTITRASSDSALIKTVKWATPVVTFSTSSEDEFDECD